VKAIMTKGRSKAVGHDKAVSKPLRYPPLSQVVFEVNFPNCFAVETRIAEYQKRVESRYPKSGAEYIVRLPAAVRFGKPPKEEAIGLTPMRSFAFDNSKGSRIIRVSVVNFSLIVTDYLHFEDYVDALTEAFTPAIDIFQLQNVERIGLRYINQIPIPTQDAQVLYKKYVQSPISAEAFSGHVPTNFLTEVSIDLASTERLTIRSGLLPSLPEVPTRTYLLDFDCYSRNITLSSQNLMHLLNKYHDAIEAQFTGAVTKEYWKHMAEGTPF
jgi:uncharacterized protein (TIGR04255 family)